MARRGSAPCSTAAAVFERKIEDLLRSTKYLETRNLPSSLDRRDQRTRVDNAPGEFSSCGPGTRIFTSLLSYKRHLRGAAAIDLGAADCLAGLKNRFRVLE